MYAIRNNANAGGVLEEYRSDPGILVGEVKLWAGYQLPKNYLWCDGQACKTTAGAAEFTLLADTIGATYGKSGTGENCTLTLDSTTITATAHGFQVGDIVFQNGDVSYFGIADTDGVYAGDLPLYVVSTNTDDFAVSDAPGGAPLSANASVALFFHDSFLLPDLRDRQAMGRADMGGTDAARITPETALLGSVGGDEKHYQVVSHTHSYDDNYDNGTVSRGTGSNVGRRAQLSTHWKNTQPTGTSGGVEHLDPYQILNFIIRYR